MTENQIIQDHYSIKKQLVIAAQEGDIQTLISFVNGKLDIPVDANFCDSDGCSLLHWAAINNHKSIVDILLDAGANINITGGILGETPLQWAIRKNYIKLSYYLIEKGANIHIKSAEGLDALQVAARHCIYINNLFIL